MFRIKLENNKKKKSKMKCNSFPLLKVASWGYDYFEYFFY